MKLKRDSVLIFLSLFVLVFSLPFTYAILTENSIKYYSAKVCTDNTDSNDCDDDNGVQERGVGCVFFSSCDSYNSGSIRAGFSKIQGYLFPG